MNVIKSGLGINEDAFVFTLTADSLKEVNSAMKPMPSSAASEIFSDAIRMRWSTSGDVMTVDAHCFDMAMWKLGGASIALRLIQLASVCLTIKPFFSS